MLPPSPEDALLSYHNTARYHNPEYLDLKHHRHESLEPKPSEELLRIPDWYRPLTADANK
jgi:hypothetical protein